MTKEECWMDEYWHDFSVSPSPLGTNLGFDLGLTWFGLALGGLGPGLDNFLDTSYFSHLIISQLRQAL